MSSTSPALTGVDDLGMAEGHRWFHREELVDVNIGLVLCTVRYTYLSTFLELSLDYRENKR